MSSSAETSKGKEIADSIRGSATSGTAAALLSVQKKTRFALRLYAYGIARRGKRAVSRI